MAATSPKKKETKPAAKKPAPKKKATAKKPVKKVDEKSVAEEVMEQVHEHEEHCECCGGDDYSEKNGPRSYVLRDVWYESLSEVISKEIMPEENKREMLFLTLSNAILDLVMDIIPQDYAKVVADNIDDFLAVTVVNKENNIDLLAKFKEDFVKEKGDAFDDEEQLQTALETFEDNWWNSKRKDLKAKTPNEALEEAAKRYGID
ncbi:MAG: hypothetical protein ABR986_05145 [Methanomassiliicoccales archaeon]